MLQAHLDLTTGEVVGCLKKDWTADIKAYDAGHAHMLKFADLLAERELPSFSPYPAVDCSEGAVKQFPDKFER